MKILVTRPIEDGEETARQLESRGHQALLAPLLTTKMLDGPEVSLDGVQAILATSANGVRALVRRTNRRDVPLFAVGPQTASQAQSAGFEIVKSADGDAQDLAKAASRWAEKDKGALLHVAGEGNDGKLMQALEGFTLRQEILYAVTAVDALPAQTVAALRLEDIDAALFYSPRSAQVFADCALKEEGLALDGVIAACISAATAAALMPLGFRQVLVASKPNQSALLKLLD